MLLDDKKIIIPDFLQSTYLLLVQSFPNGISEEYYWAILYLLYDYIADENLAIVMSEFAGKSWTMVTNDLYGVCHMKFDQGLLDEVREKLDANGFEEWKREI